MKARTQGLCQDFFKTHPELSCLKAQLLQAAEMITETYRKGGKLLLCGNGGSCADCDHIAGELLKGFLLKRPLPPDLQQRFAQFGAEGLTVAQQLQRGLPAISLAAHGGMFTAFCNDVNPDLAYAQGVAAYGQKEDLMLGISTSGHASNVAAALMTAKAMGISTLGLTGRDGGKLASLCDCCIIVPQQEIFRIQEYHLMIYHLLCAYVESELFEL